MAVTNTCLRMPRCRGIEIEECSISQLQDYLSRAAFTSRELTQCYLHRIELVNPHVKAVIETNPDALGIAEKLDEERRNGNVRTRLHGIPFVIKDNIATKDKMQTTAGCAALVGTVVPDDARIVTLLREAAPCSSGKQTCQSGHRCERPITLKPTPLGEDKTETLTIWPTIQEVPAPGAQAHSPQTYRNALVGIKPTVGLTSTVGVIPESPSIDTVGPFGRSVEDAAIVLDIIQERGAISDANDSRQISISIPDIYSMPYTSWLSKKDALKGARFGLPWKRVWESASKCVEKRSEYTALVELIEQIKKTGAEAIKVDFPSAEEIIPPAGWDWEFGDGKKGSTLSEFTVVRIEFYHSLRSYLGELAKNEGNIRSLEDVIAFNVQHTAQDGGVPGTHPAWPTGQDNFDRCLESKHWPEDVHLRALEYIRQKSRGEGIDAAIRLDGDNLDGLLVPLQADGGVACSLAAKAGYPMITVPVAVNEVGVPFGIGIIQTAWKEHKLIRYGSAIENLVGGRKQPNFLNLNADNYTYVGVSPENAAQ